MLRGIGHPDPPELGTSLGYGGIHVFVRDRIQLRSGHGTLCAGGRDILARGLYSIHEVLYEAF